MLGIVWIAFRLLLGLLGFAIRHTSGRRKRDLGSKLDGRPYWVSINRVKGKMRGFTLGMRRRSPVWLKFHRESAADRFAKRLGFSKEIQTGDERFDRIAYVTGDHPFIENVLVKRPKLRRAVADVLEEGYENVEFDGASVVIERKATEIPTEGDLALLKRVHSASKALRGETPRPFADPFFAKALVVEALIWSVFGYAVGGLLQVLGSKEDFHVSQRSVLEAGLAAAVVAFVGLAAWIRVFLRGSSRGHRIIVESWLVLFLSLPCAGIQFVSDTNRALDFSEPELVSTTVNKCDVREYRGKHNRRHYSYHLSLGDERETAALPAWIRVRKPLCEAVMREQVSREQAAVPIEISLGRGLWRIGWYRRIAIAGETWEPSL